MVAEPKIEKFINLVSILDIVTDLVINDSCRFYQTSSGEIVVIPNGAYVTGKVVESAQGFRKQRKVLYISTHLSTSIPFLLLATMSNRKRFSGGCLHTIV